MSRIPAQLLAAMLASGAMAHRPEIFLGHDIGRARPAPPQTLRDPFYDRDHDAILSAAEKKRERRRLRNCRNEARQGKLPDGLTLKAGRRMAPCHSCGFEFEADYWEPGDEFDPCMHLCGGPRCQP